MATGTIPRTGARLEAYKPKEARYEVRDGVVRGLRLRVSPSGGRSWSLWFRTKNGKASRIEIGTFPGMSLEKARKKAEDERSRIRGGADPIAEKREAKEVERLAKIEAEFGTVAALGEACLASLPLRPKTRVEWTRLLKKEIVPRFGHRLAKEITRQEVKTWGQAIAKRAPVVANRAHTLLQRIFAWAASIEEEKLAANQLAGLKPPTDETDRSRKRVLKRSELAAIMRACDALENYAAYTNGDHAAYAQCARLIFLTGVRRGSAIRAKRDEFRKLDDPKRAKWIVPPEHMKAGRKHVVPLSPAAVQIVKERLALIGEKEHLFPTRGLRKGGPSDKPMTWSSHTMALLKRTADSIHGVPLPAWQVHDSRRAIATHLRGKRFKVARPVVSAILGHVEEGARSTAIYDKQKFQSERRSALRRWARWLEVLRTGEKAKVLPFAKRA